MAKYFKIATRQARELQYKNCYDWSMVRFDEISGMCFLLIGDKLNVLTLNEVLSIHKRATRQKAYNIKPVQVAIFYGNELAAIDYAAENITSSKIVDEDFKEAIKPYIKPWPGYILKNVNDLSFLKSTLEQNAC